MKMQKSDLDHAIDWITEHWSGDERRCPVCQQSNWNLGKTISEMRSFHGGAFAFVGPVLPVVSITCLNCGLVLQFNAIQLGIVKGQLSTLPSVPASTPPSVPPTVKAPQQKAAENVVAPPSEKEGTDNG